MRKGILGWHFGLWITLLAAVLITASCGAPAAPPAVPAQTTARETPAAPVPVPAVKALSPEDAEWQGVIKAAQAEGKVVLYTDAFFVAEKRQAVPKAFKEKYGITVEILVVGTPTAEIERLQAEQRAGQPVADICGSGSTSSPRFVSLGLSQPVAQGLPVLKDKSVFVGETLYSPGGELINFGYLLTGVVANSKLVEAGEIQTWKDLLKPKFRGKLIVNDPRLGGGGGVLLLGSFRYHRAVDDDFLRTLHQQQRLALWGGGIPEIASMVARGEYLADLAGGFEVLYGPMVKEGLVNFVDTQEGTAATLAIVCVTKNAPHPNAARLFINWLLSAEGQTVYHKAGNSAPLRKDVPDFRPAEMQKTPIKKVIPMDWQKSEALRKMVADGDFEKIFGKR